MNLGLLLLIAFLILAASLVAGFRWSGAWLALTVAGTAIGMFAALWVLLGGDNWEWQSEFLLGGEPLHLRLDGLSALFLVLVSVVGGCRGGLFARVLVGPS